MRLCSVVWSCILGMSYTSVLYQFQSVGVIGGEGFLSILFKNKVGEILSMFFFIFEYLEIGKNLAKLVKFTLNNKKKINFFSISFDQEKNNESYTYK